MNELCYKRLKIANPQGCLVILPNRQDLFPFGGMTMPWASHTSWKMTRSWFILHSCEHSRTAKKVPSLLFWSAACFICSQLRVPSTPLRDWNWTLMVSFGRWPCFGWTKSSQWARIVTFDNVQSYCKSCPFLLYCTVSNSSETTFARGKKCASAAQNNNTGT